MVSENSPVTHFIVHARKCFLRGLNPHQNRTVPPLRHDWVWSLQHDFPHLQASAAQRSPCTPACMEPIDVTAQRAALPWFAKKI